MSRNNRYPIDKIQGKPWEEMKLNFGKSLFGFVPISLLVYQILQIQIRQRQKAVYQCYMLLKDSSIFPKKNGFRAVHRYFVIFKSYQPKHNYENDRNPLKVKINNRWFQISTSSIPVAVRKLSKCRKVVDNNVLLKKKTVWQTLFLLLDQKSKERQRVLGIQLDSNMLRTIFVCWENVWTMLKPRRYHDIVPLR